MLAELKAGEGKRGGYGLGDAQFVCGAGGGCKGKACEGQRGSPCEGGAAGDELTLVHFEVFLAEVFLAEVVHAKFFHADLP